MNKNSSFPQTTVMVPEGMKVMTLAGGCFWCTEAVFQLIKGVIEVKSGFSGGIYSNPTYEEVHSGKTGHAEVVQLIFDPTVVSIRQLLEIFWSTHDPTSLNSQGNDKGPQYRSIIFYHDDHQLLIAKEMKIKFNQNELYKKPILTEITKFSSFYLADNEHLDYFRQHGAHPYCQLVIQPKVNILKTSFSGQLG
jgi:peptide-methionine (S)-S-oxide reductase